MAAGPSDAATKFTLLITPPLGASRCTLPDTGGGDGGGSVLIEVKQLYKQQQHHGHSVVSTILISDPDIWVQMKYKLIGRFGFCFLRSLFEFSAGRF